MSVSPDVASLAIVATGTGFILISAITSTSIAASSLLAQKKQHASTTIYQDKDGLSTEDLTKTYSTTLVKASLAFFASAGLGVSVALAVIQSLGSGSEFRIENFVVVAAWGMIFGQSLLANLSRHPTDSYTLGIYAGLSSLVLMIVLFIQEALLVSVHREPEGVIFALRTSRLVLAAVTGLLGFLFQRRPEVFAETGEPVDRQFTTTALSRYTFDWATAILDKALKQGVLELDDLPRPDHRMRSESLATTWIQANRPGRLWVNIFRAHATAFVTQWALTAVQSFGNVAPQYMLLHILRILEERDSGRAVTSEAWIWVISLGLSQMAASWVESWLFWVCLSQLGSPVRSELAALIFRKSMRRKDVKGDTGNKKKTSPDPVDAGTESELTPDLRDNAEAAASPGTEAVNPQAKDEGEDDDSTEKKSSQSTINLIGVDAKRISEFCTFQMFFPGSVFKLIVSFWFLISIIGWKALAAGLLSILVIVPVNIYFSKRYTTAQSRLMEIRDEKEAAVSEALKGVRQIKFSALEVRWQAALEAIRGRELDTLWTAFTSDTALMFCWISSPIILSATALAVYSFTQKLTPSVAFTAIGVFNSLQLTLSIIPELTTNAIDAFVSVSRVEDYLNAPEVDRSEKKDATNVSFDRATFSFPSDSTYEDDNDRFVLRDVNISFPEKELSVISGKTGSGKSLLLAAILKEVDVISGTINIPNSVSVQDRHDDKANQSNWILPSAVAYVAQIPWIENASIKDNILFGLPLDQHRYEETIESCALKKDLDMLPDGERTEIGANGINLSGGQKWRLSFARALYSRAGILVMDDIFSAVDAHVGRHLFEKGLMGPLGTGRTRILVTHHVELCKSQTKYLVELGDGTVMNAGLLSELEEDGTLSKIISHQETPAEIALDQETTAVNSEDSASEAEEGEPLKKVDTRASVRKFVEEETKEKGGVSSKHYVEYLKASGGMPFWTFACIIFIGQQALSLGRTWWLRNWTQANEHSAAAHSISMTLFVPYYDSSFATRGSPGNDDNLVYWLGGYVAISLGSAFLATFTFFYIFWGSVKASKVLFNRMLSTVIRAPLRWHDTVPLGRILNRFTADFNVVDSNLANNLSFGARCILELVGIFLAGFLVSFYVVILAFVLAGVCILIAKRYLVGAREAKRLEAIVKSPIFSTFGATLSGISTIRAFDKTEEYVKSMSTTIDNHITALWHLYLFNRWFTLRISIIGGLFSAVVAALIITLPGIDAPTAGFALFFALEYSSAVTWAIRQYTEIELAMNASERILEYCVLPTESQEGNHPPASWPTDGRLEVHDLSVSYAPDLPPVLKNLTFSIERNQRVGVVGRTGAGKSSLTLALFRFLEAQTGAIYIDGLDISKIKLADLRSRLAIIPQDPVLFSGTVRSNLDPFEERSNAELLDALQRVHLIPSDASGSATPTGPQAEASEAEDKNKNVFKSLKSEISTSGLNLSQGQRQLLCLARAIVSRPKIMVLDEATSAVDMATDALIQRSIREEFMDSTLIVIAHRLSTIADFDKILVLDQGEVREFGTPIELLEKEGGVFKGMVGDSGERDQLIRLIRKGNGRQ